jgi:hypothetical protein
MKIFVAIFCLMFPVVVTAQNQGMSGGDMQKMMQMMQEMQQCMAKVDQAELEAIESESEKIGKELETLCAKGERKKAQKKAIAYSKKIMENPALAQMKKCTEMTKGLVPENSTPSFEEGLDFSNRHVCDE